MSKIITEKEFINVAIETINEKQNAEEIRRIQENIAALLIGGTNAESAQAAAKTLLIIFDHAAEAVTRINAGFVKKAITLDSNPANS